MESENQPVSQDTPKDNPLSPTFPHEAARTVQQMDHTPVHPREQPTHHMTRRFSSARSLNQAMPTKMQEMSTLSNPTETPTPEKKKRGRPLGSSNKATPSKKQKMASSPAAPRNQSRSDKRKPGRPYGSLNISTPSKKLDKGNTHVERLAPGPRTQSSEQDISFLPQPQTANFDIIEFTGDDNSMGQPMGHAMRPWSRTPSRIPQTINATLLAKIQPTLDYLKRQSAYLDSAVESAWQAEGSARTQKSTKPTLDEFKKTLQDAALLREGAEVLGKIMNIGDANSSLRVLDSDVHVGIGATEPKTPDNAIEVEPVNNNPNAGSEDDLSAFARPLPNTITDVIGEAEQRYHVTGGVAPLGSTSNSEAQTTLQISGEIGRAKSVNSEKGRALKKGEMNMQNVLLDVIDEPSTSEQQLIRTTADPTGEAEKKPDTSAEEQGEAPLHGNFPNAIEIRAALQVPGEARTAPLVSSERGKASPNQKVVAEDVSTVAGRSSKAEHTDSTSLSEQGNISLITNEQGEAPQ